jgi:hypothetical protein
MPYNGPNKNALRFARIGRRGIRLLFSCFLFICIDGYFMYIEKGGACVLRLVPSGNPHPLLDFSQAPLEIHTHSLEFGIPQSPLEINTHRWISTFHSGITQPPPAVTSNACSRRLTLRARQCGSRVYYTLAVPAKAIADSALLLAVYRANAMLLPPSPSPLPLLLSPLGRL